MTDSEKIKAFERKLEHLKEEEKRILKLLKDVRKQMKKYEVEELQTCSESLARSGEEESDSDESFNGDQNLLLQVLDCAKSVNKTSLNLDLNQILERKSDEESEESDESEELCTI